jgi:hypothetical protein
MSSKNLSKTTNVILWILQGLLGAVFLFAGGAKLFMSAEALTAQSPFSAGFIRFIGVAEVAGALGLILPGALKIRPELTPLAAIGLGMIMVGAVVTSASGGVQMAVVPFVVGVLTAVVAFQRAPRFGRQPTTSAPATHVGESASSTSA